MLKSTFKKIKTGEHTYITSSSKSGEHTDINRLELD